MPREHWDDELGRSPEVRERPVQLAATGLCIGLVWSRLRA